MKAILKYGLDTTTKTEGWIVIQRDLQGIHYFFIPKTEDNCQRLLKSGSSYTSSDIKEIEPHKLAIFCTNMFETDEEFYINAGGRLIGNTKKDNLEFWVKPIVLELA